MFVEPFFSEQEEGEGEGRRQIGLRVKGLLPGGPAASSERIEVGDMLLQVDGEEVAGQPLK
eukprot:768250-Hanusia_phi.AAC.1